MTTTSQGLASRCQLLAIDFDETLTVKDSCAVLGGLAIRAAPPAQQPIRQQHWEALVAQLLAQHAAEFPQLLPSPAAASWNPARFAEFVEALRAFDARANLRLVASLDGISDGGGALAGISESALRAAALTEVEPRPGAAAVLRRLMASSGGFGGEVLVLSACWSDVFISAALQAHFLPTGALPGSLPAVCANTLELAESGDGSGSDLVSNGRVQWRVATAGDKVQRLRERTSRTADLTIMIGDSVGDLPAMLAADLGIVVKESSSLRTAIVAFGLELLPLGPLLAQAGASGGRRLAEELRLGRREQNEPPPLLQASGWEEVDRLLFG